MSRRAVDAVFQGLYLLTDLRMLLRESVPDHRLSDEQRSLAEKTIGKIEKQVAILKEELLS